MTISGISLLRLTHHAPATLTARYTNTSLMDGKWLEENDLCLKKLGLTVTFRTNNTACGNPDEKSYFAWNTMQNTPNIPYQYNNKTKWKLNQKKEQASLSWPCREGLGTFSLNVKVPRRKGVAELVGKHNNSKYFSLFLFFSLWYFYLFNLFLVSYDIVMDPWTARGSNQSILKEINSEYSLEGLMLKLKLQ